MEGRIFQLQKWRCLWHIEDMIKKKKKKKLLFSWKRKEIVVNTVKDLECKHKESGLCLLNKWESKLFVP